MKPGKNFKWINREIEDKFNYMKKHYKKKSEKTVLVSPKAPQVVNKKYQIKFPAPDDSPEGQMPDVNRGTFYNVESS